MHGPQNIKICGLFVNTIRQPKNSLLDPEDEGSKILRNRSNYLAVGTA
jgi:hypothetical protein